MSIASLTERAKQTVLNGGHKTCPNVAHHTPAPEGYCEWHDWAERMGKTHRQKRCPVCGLYAIWEKKAKTRKEVSNG